MISSYKIRISLVKCTLSKGCAGGRKQGAADGFFRALRSDRKRKKTEKDGEAAFAPFPVFLKSLLYAEMRCFSAFSFKKSAANYLHSKKK